MNRRSFLNRLGVAIAGLAIASELEFLGAQTLKLEVDNSVELDDNSAWIESIKAEYDKAFRQMSRQMHYELFNP